MAKFDLSEAIEYASGLPEIKYSNIGSITREMQSLGFDPKTAKMALMLIFKENPMIKENLRTSGVNAMQAAKVLFEANVEYGDILDRLIQMGFLRDEAVDAIKNINLDEGNQDISQFTERPHPDNAYEDYADPGYEYDDIPPEAIQALIDASEEDRDSAGPETFRNVLEQYDVSQSSISQLNDELFGKEAAGNYDDTEKVKQLIMGKGEALNPDIEAILMAGMNGGSRPYDVLFAMITNHMIGNPEDFVKEVMHMAVEPYNESVRETNPYDVIQEDTVNWQEVWEWMIDHVQRYWASQKQKFEDREPEFDEEGNNKEYVYMGADPEFYDRYYEEPWKFSSVRTSSIKTSVDLSWRELGIVMQDAGIPEDQIISILKQNGASDEEAHAAAIPIEGQQVAEEEGGPGAPSNAPEDLDLGASGDFPYSAGMDLDGPGGLNDSLEGAPGPPDFSGTGGGYMSAPDDTADGDFFAEAPSGSSGGYLEDMAKDYVSKDPQMTRGDMIEILKNEGADKQEANQVADKLKLEDSPSIRPGVTVRSAVGVGTISSTWETMYGKMANVISEDGSEYEFMTEDLEILSSKNEYQMEEPQEFPKNREDDEETPRQQMKDEELAAKKDERYKVATGDELVDKVSEHLNGEWFETLSTTSADYRQTYSNRIEESRTLLSQVNNRLASTKDIGTMAFLTDARDALDNEINFCRAKLADSSFLGEEEYVESLPKYEFAREASLGNAMGPGGGESMVLVADEMEKEAAETEWNETLITSSIDFVNQLPNSIVGDAQEVAKMAFHEFSTKVASVEDGKRQELISEFMKNVEDVRRRVAADAKKWDKPWTEEDESEEDESEETKSDKKKKEAMVNLKKKIVPISDEGWLL
jgi:hypothetical protein